MSHLLAFSLAVGAGMAPSLLLLLLLLALDGRPSHACTSIIVGGEATTDGSIYVARTDDTGMQGNGMAWWCRCGGRAAFCTWMTRWCLWRLQATPGPQ